MMSDTSLSDQTGCRSVPFLQKADFCLSVNITYNVAHLVANNTGQRHHLQVCNHFSCSVKQVPKVVHWHFQTRTCQRAMVVLDFTTHNETATRFVNCLCVHDRHHRVHLVAFLFKNIDFIAKKKLSGRVKQLTLHFYGYDDDDDNSDDVNAVSFAQTLLGSNHW